MALILSLAVPMALVRWLLPRITHVPRYRLGIIVKLGDFHEEGMAFLLIAAIVGAYCAKRFWGWRYFDFLLGTILGVLALNVVRFLCLWLLPGVFSRVLA